jgi:large subunit ribosomal protein L24
MTIKLNIKKGDTVLVLSGNDRGKQGLVREAFPREQRVIVDGVNLHTRHKKPSQHHPKGQIVRQEAPIHVSNLRRIEAAQSTAAGRKSKAGSRTSEPGAAKAKATKKASDKG